MKFNFLNFNSDRIQDEYIVQKKNQFKIEGLYIVLGALFINILQGFIRDALTSHVILSLLIILFFTSYYILRETFSGIEYPDIASKNRYKQKRKELTVYVLIFFVIFLTLNIGDKFLFHPEREWFDIFSVSIITLIILFLINYFSVKRSYNKNKDISD